MTAALLWPLAYALLVWWFSTGVILWLDGLPRPTYAWSLGGATLVLVGGLWGLHHTRMDVSATGAYCAFTCALLVWAWQELAFLLGVVTGPHRQVCPPLARGWQRTRLAIATVLHHEIALLGLAVAVWVMTEGGTNRTGWWTFVALWVMRQSAKLNVFLGVRNIGDNFLPPHLRYMASYFRRAPMNPLFPVSVTLGTGAAVLVWWRLIEGPTSAFDTAGLALVGSMLALGALEHWLLVLPLPTDALWRWGMQSHQGHAGAAAAAAALASAPAPVTPTEAG